MNFNEYEEFVKATPLYDEAEMGLIGEIGEVFELIKKHNRQGNKKQVMTKERFVEEMGDVLYYFTRTANKYGANLNEIAMENEIKLRKRHGM